MSNKIQLYTVYFICKLLYIFRVVFLPIIGITNNCIYSIWYWGTAVAQWLRCCATNRKVAGSIPGGVIGIFH